MVIESLYDINKPFLQMAVKYLENYNKNDKMYCFDFRLMKFNVYDLKLTY